MKKLSGMLVFVCLDKAVPCFDKDKGKEFKAGVVVDEDTADAFAEIFAKQPAKKVKRSEFESIYKVEPPEGTEKNLYVITLKKNEKLANGEDIPDKYRPRVFLQEGNTRKDITFSTLVGNGSYGAISIDRYDNDYGSSARLQNILVTDLVEYERRGSDYQAGDEFNDDNADDGEGNSIKVPAKAAKTSTKPASKSQRPVVLDDMSDESPF